MKEQFFIRLKNRLFPLFFALILTAILLCFIFGNFAYAVTDGIALFVGLILPSLFPFVFITSIISKLKIALPFRKFWDKICLTVFKTDSVILKPFFISLTCGHPLGSKVVADLKGEGRIDENSSRISAVLCSNPSPSFCLVVIGKTVYDDILFGFIVYSICVVSAVISAILCAIFTKKPTVLPNNPKPYAKPQPFSLYDSVSSSISSVFTVGGIITLFYLFSEMLFAFNILSPLTALLSKILCDEEVANAVTRGFLECTNGLKYLSNLGIKNLSVLVGLCSFGGLSILLQSTAFLKREKIKTVPFISFKIIGTIIAVSLSFLIVGFGVISP